MGRRNKEYQRTYQKEWRSRPGNKLKIRDIKLRYTHGLTLDAWEAMFSGQGRKCAACRTDQPGGKGEWCTDHSHATGQIRGILCHGCNISLGMMKDNTARLLALIEYLDRNDPCQT